MERHQYPLESLFGRVLTPFQLFLRRTTAGGIVLGVAALAALAAASTFGEEALHHFFDQPIALGAGARFELKLSLHHWINDGLMALFFLLVGLELKREMLVGELASLRDAALPVVAAAGGMIVPAAIFAAINAGTPTAAGWGIPMATDIAFAVGILVLLASRVPKNLIIFLMALAIADDLGAVLVIAFFYTAEIRTGYLFAAGVLFALLVLFNRAGVRRVLPYVLVGVPFWFAVHGSGVHATLAGVLLALAIPAFPNVTPAHFEARLEELLTAFRADRRNEATPDDPLRNEDMATLVEAVEDSAIAVQSPLQRLEHGLTPWVAFVVIPVFALANSGIDLTQVAWAKALADPLVLGVAAGLVLGKFVGISAFSWAAVRLGIARLPSGVEWKHVLGAAWLGGIGFTMALFISQLAFDNPELVEVAKVGVLLGSAVAAVVGLAWLYVAGARRSD